MASTSSIRITDYYYARQALLDLFIAVTNDLATNAHNAALAAADLAEDAQATADGKVQSFYSPTAPTAEGIGDLWFDTDDGYRIYRWGGSSWLPVQDTRIPLAISLATGAQDTADGKASTFFAASAPVAEGIGDLWYNTVSKTLSRWDGAAWVLVSTIGTPPGTDVGGIPVEVTYGLTPSGMSENWSRHPDTASISRAWNITGDPWFLYPNAWMTGGKAVYATGPLTMVGHHRVAYAYEDMYRVRARIWVSGTGSGNNHYIGFTAYDETGAELTGTDGGSYHYVAGTAADLPTGFHMFEGYFRGRADIGAGNRVGVPAPDPSTPATAKTGAVAVAPLLLINYGGSGGQAYIDYIEIEKVEDLTMLPTREWAVGDRQQKGQVVTYLGRSWVARVENTGVAPPSTSIGTATWALLVDKGSNGTPGSNGLNGLSVAELTIYRRAASPPAAPVGGSFDFALQTLTPPASWQVTEPAPDGNPLYKARGIASIIGSSGLDTPDWGSAVLSQTDAESVDVVFVRSATQPATPAGSAGVPAGWYGSTDAVPAGPEPLWASHGSRPSPALNWTWQVASRITGEKGDTGETGQSTRKAYMRAAAKPATPAVSGGTPAGWYDDPDAVPAGAGYIWLIDGTKAVGATTWTWTGAVRHEAVATTATSATVALGIYTTSWITFSLASGEGRNFSAQLRGYASGSATIDVSFEGGVDGGGTSALGSSDGPATGYAETLQVSASGSIFNGATYGQTYRVRATGTRTGPAFAVEAASSYFRC